jgi:hypothetical protein
MNQPRTARRRTSDQAQSRVWCLVATRAYNRPMTGITIYVDWTYFLGIVGTLIGIAYYANGRFTKIETTVEWLKATLLEIKKQLERDGVQKGTTLSTRASSHRYQRTKKP